MKSIMMNTGSRLWPFLLVSSAAALVFSTPILAQDSSVEKAGIPQDWTHHHVVFADAGTAEQAMQNGTYDRWLAMTSDPRYQHLRARRIAAARVPTTVHEENFGLGVADEGDAPGEADSDARRDSGAPFPLPRGLTKATTAPPLAGANGDRVQDSESGSRFRLRGRKAHPHNGEKLDWSETLGSGGSLGLGNYPAKFSFSSSTASCSDWVVYGTGLAGSATQATILAFTNLYASTCSGSVPSVSWAFNTGTGSTILTSPVLSLDGTQIAFVQNGSTSASLVILKWSASGTLTAPTALASQASGSAYRTCTAPCMFSIGLSGAATDTGSSAWYDYGLDTAWVGDDNGVLHKFTGIFKGSPAEVTTGGWPVTVSASALNGPILDPVTGNVFVGDYNLTVNSACTPSSTTTNAPCGFLYSYNASTGALKAKSAQLDFNSGIVGTPALDQTAGQLYVPVGSDGETGASTKCKTDTPCAAVFQLPTNFSNGASGTEATVGPGFNFLLIGAFDNTYFTSANAASPTGYLYVVGNTGAADNTLYQISITANVMNTTSAVGPAVAKNFTNGFFAAGLNVTEFFNGTTDYIFLSTIAFCGATPSIGTGCVVGFNVTNGVISPTASSTAAGGASGIIVDNSGSAAGESNIYFSTLSNQLCTTSNVTGGCAIQISQSVP